MWSRAVHLGARIKISFGFVWGCSCLGYNNCELRQSVEPIDRYRREDQAEKGEELLILGEQDHEDDR